MITELRVSNFYSFGEDTTISFIKGGNKVEGGYAYINKTQKVSLINGFFGANASGKSNILRAISTLIKFTGIKNSSLVSSFSKKYLDKPIKLGLNILHEGKHFAYDISVKDNLITYEKLEELTISGKTKKIIFEIKENKKYFSSDLNDINDYLQSQELPSKETILSKLNFLEHNVTKIFRSSLGFTISHISDISHLAYRHNLIDDLLYIDKYSKETTLKGLKIFDPTIEDIIINKIDDKTSIHLSHKNFAKNVQLEDESKGTQELFFTFYYFISILKVGFIAVYDELNRSFHPEIQNIIYQMFLDPKFNRNNAQLFFSSHDHEIMNQLKLDQILIVEKDQDSSKVFKLSQVEGVNSRDNIAKKYRIGFFGGVPDENDLKYLLSEILYE